MSHYGRENHPPFVEIEIFVNASRLVDVHLSVDAREVRVDDCGVRIVRLAIVFGAILHLGGGHWGVLQGLAWMKMLVEYSQADGLREGMAKTFDGQHPCEMCESIAKGRELEEKDPQAPVRVNGLALKELLPMSVIRIHRRDVSLPIQPAAWATDRLVAQWSPSPDEPPPRLAIS